MPEAAVYENRLSVLRKHDVRTARQVFSVQPKAIPEPVKHAAHDHLRCRVLALHGLHDAASLFGAAGVQDASSFPVVGGNPRKSDKDRSPAQCSGFANVRPRRCVPWHGKYEVRWRASNRPTRRELHGPLEQEHNRTHCVLRPLGALISHAMIQKTLHFYEDQIFAADVLARVARSLSRLKLLTLGPTAASSALPPSSQPPAASHQPQARPAPNPALATSRHTRAGRRRSAPDAAAR